MFFESKKKSACIFLFSLHLSKMGIGVRNLKTSFFKRSIDVYAWLIHLYVEILIFQLFFSLFLSFFSLFQSKDVCPLFEAHPSCFFFFFFFFFFFVFPQTQRVPAR